MRKTIFFFFLVASTVALVGFDKAQGAEDLVVAVDKSTMVKILAAAFTGLVVEVWRNQRALFKITTAMGKEMKEMKGYCKGRTGDCASGSAEADED
jgi:hypothetical protein